MIEQHGPDGANREEYKQRESGDLRYVQHVKYSADDHSGGMTENHRQQAPVKHIPRHLLLNRDRLQP